MTAIESPAHRRDDPHPAASGTGASGNLPSAAAGPPVKRAGGDLGPEKATYPFGPKTCAWLAKHMPIAVYGAKCVADADRNAQRARAMAESEAA